MTIPVVFSSNKKYLPYLAVAIVSLISNIKNEKLAIFILHNGLDLSDKDIKKINNLHTESAKIEWIDVTKYLDSVQNNLIECHHYSKEMYNRILIPEIFPQFEKVVYLDCDIVVNCNIKELYDIDLQDKFIAAVPDIGQQLNNQELSAVVEKNKYFNSGVIVFNCQKLQAFQLFKKFVEKLKELKNFTFPDQDLINILLEDKIHYLDYSFNIQQAIKLTDISLLTAINKTFKSYLISCRNPKIIHFTSDKKPLESAKYDYGLIWHSYFSQTQFYEDYFFRNAAEQLQKTNKFKLLSWQIKATIMKKKKSYYQHKISKYFADKAFLATLQTKNKEEKDLK